LAQVNFFITAYHYGLTLETAGEIVFHQRHLIRDIGKHRRLPIESP
jgi:hypothetical protein